MNLGGAIRSAREELGVGIKKLAAELDIDYSHLSKIENCHIKPSKDLLMRLAYALQKDVDEWLILSGCLPTDIARAAAQDPAGFLKNLRRSKYCKPEGGSVMKKNTRNPVISLFTGAGGMDLGLEEAGFDTVLSVEFNPVFRQTIRLNRPDWNPVDDHNGDVTKISVDYILEKTGLKPGQAALVVGGAPCQPFSNLGSKRGTADSRGTLFQDFIRIVKGVRPKGFIFENVEGLTQDKHKGVISTLESAFANLGYRVSSKILLAADYGVPQKRKRLFVIGVRSGKNAPSFPEPTHSKTNEPGKKAWVTVREAFAKIPKERLNQNDCHSMNHSPGMLKRLSLVPAGGNFKDLPKRLLPDCWKSGKYQGQDTFGRVKWNEPSVTIRTCGYNPTKGRYIHPSENRGLNTIEMAVLQSFPIDYKYCGGLKTVGEQIGNAVPPGLAKAVGLSMKEAIGLA